MICVTDWRLHSILQSVPLHPCRAAPQLGETPLAARGRLSVGRPPPHQPFGLDFGQRDDYISPAKAT